MSGVRRTEETVARSLSRIVVTMTRAVDPEKVFLELSTDSSAGAQVSELGAFWLDGQATAPERSRFTHLGVGGGPLSRRLSYRVGESDVEVTGADGRVVRREGTILDVLAAELAADRLDGRATVGEGHPEGFTGGWVGYFGYEIGALCGVHVVGAPADAVPDAQWLFADRIITIDHHRDRTYLIAVTDGRAEVIAAARAWLTDTKARLERLSASADANSAAAEARAVIVSLGVEDAAVAEPWLDRDRTRYLADVQTCLHHLRAGDTYEVCLTDAVRLPAPADPLGFYLRLRQVNPAPYAGYLRFGDLHIASSSPERFLAVRDGIVETRPIKGTVRRGGDAAEDTALRDALASDPKTRAENLMIVDLLRNDLTRVCEVGSVATPGLMVIESYATVHQMVSVICGRLRSGKDVVDAIHACFPGGSMTGAPKRRTTQIIAELEQRPRGVYSGAFGYLGLDGVTDLAMVIRTAVIHGDECHVGAGGAVVLDSDPQAEFEEMLLKAATVVRAHPLVDGAAR